MTSLVTVGIDIGGTGTRFVCVDSDNRLVREAIHRTPTEGDVAGWLIECVHALCPEARLRGVGIGASGPIDASGVIRNPDTLPAFTGVELLPKLEAALGVPVKIDNDAVTAALGEYAAASANAQASLMMVTLGTGVGVAAIVNGRPFRDARGEHPEGGHIPVPEGGPCYCGLTSCWEQVASRSALERRVHEENWGSVDECADSARAGEPAGMALFTSYGQSVAAGILTWTTVLNPESIVFGGSASRFLPLFDGPIRDALASRVGSAFVTPDIRVSELGDLGGALGAAYLVG